MDMGLVHSSVEVAISFKKCSKCKDIKPVSDFNKCKSNKDGLYYYCRSCDNKQGKLYKSSNPLSKIKKELKREKAKQQIKLWRNENPEKSKEYQREYGKTYGKNRRQNDISFRIRDNLTTRIWFALKGGVKSKGTIEMLGCSIEFFKSHLEAKFQEGMTWDNYGRNGWEIDHIKPCSKFDLSKIEQQLLCFHYSNMQPLWWQDNNSKRDKYI